MVQKMNTGECTETKAPTTAAPSLPSTCSSCGALDSAASACLQVMLYGDLFIIIAATNPSKGLNFRPGFLYWLRSLAAEPDMRSLIPDF